MERDPRSACNRAPLGARDWRIATVFDATALEPKYSVLLPFRRDSDVVRTDTLAWFHPGQGLELERLVLPDACDRVGEQFDLILKWDRASARFEAARPGGLQAQCRKWNTSKTTSG